MVIIIFLSLTSHLINLIKYKGAKKQEKKTYTNVPIFSHSIIREQLKVVKVLFHYLYTQSRKM